MSRRTQDVRFEQASQTLVLDCPDGRPSSVTDVQIWDTSSDDTATEEAAITGTPAVESTPNTTVDVISGAGQTDPTKINVAATSGAAVGRRYIIASTRGHFEWFECAGIVSADYLLAKHPLLNSYEITTATVKSPRVTATLDTTWVSDVSNLSQMFNPNPRYRVRWTVVIDSVTQVYESSFDLVRYTAQHHVTPLDVADEVSDWLDWLPADDRDNQGRSFIESAWRAVKFDLYGDNKADQAIRNPEALDELVLRRAVWMSTDRPGADPDAVALAKTNYRQRYDQMVRSPVIAVDVAGGGAAAPIRPTYLGSR